MGTYTVVRNEHAGHSLRWLTFDRAPVGYAEPGQFVCATVGGERAYYAIASSPGQPLELLVKAAGEVAETVAGLAPGDQLEATGALGDGFRAPATRPRPLVCFVNGSALSAVRPVISAEVAAGVPRPVTLLYGVLSPDHVAFAEDLDGWARAGVEVVLVLDRGSAGWAGEVGFVQDVAVGRGLVRDDVAVLVCGVPAMHEAVVAAYHAAGLDPTLVLTNF